MLLPQFHRLPKVDVSSTSMYNKINGLCLWLMYRLSYKYRLSNLQASIGEVNVSVMLQVSVKK